MSYGFLKLKEIRYTGSDFDSEEFDLNFTVNTVTSTETVELKRNYYTKLDIPLKELSYSTSTSISVDLVVRHNETSVSTSISNVTLLFESSLGPQLIERHLELTHPTELTEKIYLDATYEFSPYPAFYTEYKAMLDCLKRMEELYFAYSDGGTLDGLFNTLKNTKLPDLYSDYWGIASALSLTTLLPTYNGSETFVVNINNLNEVNEAIKINWNETTIGSTLISAAQSEFNTFKTAFLALKDALEALGIFLCDKYFEWRGPGELFEDYAELQNCLCKYEAQYGTLSPTAKLLVDDIRDKLGDFLGEIQDYAKSKGYAGVIPAPFTSNMCSLFEQTRAILGFLKTYYKNPAGPKQPIPN